MKRALKNSKPYLNTTSQVAISVHANPRIETKRKFLYNKDGRLILVPGEKSQWLNAKETYSQDLCLSQLAHIISISRRAHILGWHMLMLFVIREGFLWMSNTLLSALQPLCRNRVGRHLCLGLSGMSRYSKISLPELIDIHSFRGKGWEQNRVLAVGPSKTGMGKVTVRLEGRSKGVSGWGTGGCEGMKSQ